MLLKQGPVRGERLLAEEISLLYFYLLQITQRAEFEPEKGGWGVWAQGAQEVLYWSTTRA